MVMNLNQMQKNIKRQYLKRKRNKPNPNHHPMMYQMIQSNHRKPRPVVVKNNKRRRLNVANVALNVQRDVP